MGAVTVANRAHGVADRGKVVEADVTFSASYATGGDTVALADLGMNGVREVLVPSHHISTRKPIADANVRTGKTVQLAGTQSAPTLKVYDTANTEVSAATDLSGTTVRLRFVGF